MKNDNNDLVWSQTRQFPGIYSGALAETPGPISKKSFPKLVFLGIEPESYSSSAHSVHRAYEKTDTSGFQRKMYVRSEDNEVHSFFPVATNNAVAQVETIILK